MDLSILESIAWRRAKGRSQVSSFSYNTILQQNGGTLMLKEAGHKLDRRESEGTKLGKIG